MAKLGTVAGQDDWQVESDMRTLMDAEKIKKDHKRMTKVRALARARLIEVASIATDGDGEDC